MTKASESDGRFTGGVTAVGSVTAVGLAGAAVLAMSSGNTEFILYIVVVILLALVVLAVHLRVGLSTPLLAALSGWALMHMAGGLVPVPDSWPINGDIRVLYSWWILRFGEGGLKYDHVVHAYGFGVATWLCWAGLRHLMGGGRPTIGALTLAVLAACGLGAFNEVVEFGATLVTETNVGGYANTAWDLVANLAGATGAALLIRLTDRARPSASSPDAGSPPRR